MRVLDHDGLKAKGVAYSKPHIWRLVKAGRFPAPIKWGAARNGWIEEEIDRHIESKSAERDVASVSSNTSTSFAAHVTSSTPQFPLRMEYDPFTGVGSTRAMRLAERSPSRGTRRWSG